MSDIERAVALLVAAFSKYSGQEGDKNTLTPAELKNLLQNELAGLLGKATDKSELDKIFKALDTNQDNSVDFCEFTRLVGCIAMICHECFCNK